ACHGGAVGTGLLRSSRGGALRDRQANTPFTFLGIASFALAVTLGFLIYWSDDPLAALHRLAGGLAPAGIPVLITGLMVHGGEEVSGPVRTGGTAVALVGAAVMLLAVALAWPQPVALLVVCTLDFAVLTAVALRGRLPLAHAAAVPCLA